MMYRMLLGFKRNNNPPIHFAIYDLTFLIKNYSLYYFIKLKD